MIINRDTNIYKIIKENDAAIDAIASINTNFIKLRNPFLRRVLASKINITTAAKIGNTTVNELMKVLENIGFEVNYDKDKLNNNNQINNSITTMTKEHIIDLDVRPVLDSGIDPFNKIMETLKTLKEDETLRIINTFEPIPLLNILKSKGYEYETLRPEDGVVHTFLKKIANSDNKDNSIPKFKSPYLTYEDAMQKYAGKLIEIDVRDLEMPMPMVSILEAIETLEEGHALFVHHKKLPQYLIPELEERNFEHKSKEIDENYLKLIIYRK